MTSLFSDSLEKLFDIARRVPFLAMTIVERNSMDAPWLFRTQPLQTGPTQSTHEVALQLAPIPTPVPSMNHEHVMIQRNQQQQVLQRQVPQKHHQPSPHPHPNALYMQPNSAQHQQRPRPLAGSVLIDPKKVVKSSTAPNLPTSNSLSQMFRVI